MTEQQEAAMRMALEAMEYADACLKKQLTTKTKHEYAQDLLLEAGTALRQALEQQPAAPVKIVKWNCVCGRTMTVEHEGGIEQQPADEPVGEVDAIGLNGTDFHVTFNRSMPLGTRLYTRPKPAAWVGLTDEELEPLCNEWRIVFGSWTYDFARAIEAKLKEKNGHG